MARAPKPGGPGTSAHNDKVEAATREMRMTVRGETRTIRPGNIPIGEKLIVRKATGLPFEAFMGNDDKIGEDSVLVMWWLAGRATNPFLTWKQACADWPTDLTEDDIEVELSGPDVEPAGDDPEA